MYPGQWDKMQHINLSWGSECLEPLTILNLSLFFKEMDV